MKRLCCDREIDMRQCIRQDFITNQAEPGGCVIRYVELPRVEVHCENTHSDIVVNPEV